MSDQKPLSKQNRDELVATAEGLGLEVAEDATKAQIIEQIEAAPAPVTPADPADPGAQDGGQDDGGDPDLSSDGSAGDDADIAQDVSDADEASGLVTITRPIEHRAANGDWIDPFSGLRVTEGSLACTQSGAVRDEDFETARVLVSPERAAELGA